MAQTIRRQELHVEVSHSIGSGGTSVVYQGLYRGEKIAMKVLRNANSKNLHDELTALIKLRHDRILILRGVCEDLLPSDGGRIALITQLMERGSLYRVLHDATAHAVRPSSTAEKLRLALDISEGLAYLHNNRVIHRDMKSGNVLVDEHGRAKIADFGLAAINDHTKSYVSGVVGTYAWAAPEVMNDEKMSTKADIYSLGVILWEVFTLSLPWEGLAPMQIMTRVCLKNERLAIPVGLSRECPAVADLIAACFSVDTLRPTADTIQSTLRRELEQLPPPPRGLEDGTALLLQAIQQVGAKVDVANRKLDDFVTLSQEQFEMVSLIEVRGNLMPYTFVIMSEVAETKGFLGWWRSSVADLVWSRSRLRFICPITNQFVDCGPGPGPTYDGYPINIPREWVVKMAPALKYGITFLKVALATEGLGGLVDLSKLTPGGVGALSKMMDQMNLLPGVEAAAGDAPMDYLSSQVDDLVKYTEAPPDEDAKQAFELVFRFLAHAELDGQEPFPGWKPQLTGLTLVAPSQGGRSLWVSREGEAEFRRNGVSALHRAWQGVGVAGERRAQDDRSPGSVSPLASTAARSARGADSSRYNSSGVDNSGAGVKNDQSTGGPADTTTAPSTTATDSTSTSALKAAVLEAKMVADIRAKAEQEAEEIRQKAARDAAATTAAAQAKDKEEAQRAKDNAAREIAALKAKAEQEAKEVRERAEREAKAKAAAGE